jgi:hypothetical protein
MHWSTESPFGTGPISPPLIADVNDDGRTDVVSQLGNGVAGLNVIIVSSPDTGELISTSPQLDRGVINGTGKALADIDLDGYVEIISIGGENSGSVPDMTRIFAFEHDGTFKWKSEQLAERYFVNGFLAFTGDGRLDGAEPTIADLDQDGTPEIIVGHGVGASIATETGVAVTAFDNQGMKLFTSYARGRGSSPAAPSCAPRSSIWIWTAIPRSSWDPRPFRIPASCSGTSTACATFPRRGNADRRQPGQRPLPRTGQDRFR